MRCLDIDGNTVKPDDPARMVWYGYCTYWTDDWDKLKLDLDYHSNEIGMPLCPCCGAPGFQMAAGRWFAGASTFQAMGNPGYVSFVENTKEQCVVPRPKSSVEWYRQWLKEHPNGRVTNPRSGG